MPRVGYLLDIFFRMARRGICSLRDREIFFLQGVTFGCLLRDDRDAIRRPLIYIFIPSLMGFKFFGFLVQYISILYYHLLLLISYYRYKLYINLPHDKVWITNLYLIILDGLDPWKGPDWLYDNIKNYQ